MSGPPDTKGEGQLFPLAEIDSRIVQSQVGQCLLPQEATSRPPNPRHRQSCR